MEDAERMAILYRVDNLQEDTADEGVVFNVLWAWSATIFELEIGMSKGQGTYPMSFGDHPKQIPFVAEIEDHKDVISLLDDLVHGDDVGVPAGQLV